MNDFLADVHPSKQLYDGAMSWFTWEHPLIQLVRSVSPMPIHIPISEGQHPATQLRALRESWDLGSYFGMCSEWVMGPTYLHPPPGWDLAPAATRGWPAPWAVANMSCTWRAMCETIPGIVCMAMGIEKGWIDAWLGPAWPVLESIALIESENLGLCIWWFNIDMENIPTLKEEFAGVNLIRWEKAILNPWKITGLNGWKCSDLWHMFERNELKQRRRPRPQTKKQAIIVPSEDDRWLGLPKTMRPKSM